MSNSVFVARERELVQLDSFLHRAISGDGVVCFVIGEAGSGKTTLVSEFTKRAMAIHQDLVVAVGQSDAQTGIGDPYLPFREVLAQLTGDVDAKLAQGTISEENAALTEEVAASADEVQDQVEGVNRSASGLAQMAAEMQGAAAQFEIGSNGAGPQAAVQPTTVLPAATGSASGKLETSSSMGLGGEDG